MWEYEKRLQYPVKITKPNPKFAKLIITQYGGGDGELGASLRYLSQRFSMPNAFAKGLLNDIGLSFTILHLYTKTGNAYCFQYALPFSLYHFKT